MRLWHVHLGGRSHTRQQGCKDACGCLYMGARPRSEAIRPPYFSGCIWAIGFSFMIAAGRQRFTARGRTFAVEPVEPALGHAILRFRAQSEQRPQLLFSW